MLNAVPARCKANADNLLIFSHHSVLLYPSKLNPTVSHCRAADSSDYDRWVNRQVSRRLLSALQLSRALYDGNGSRDTVMLLLLLLLLSDRNYTNNRDNALPSPRTWRTGAVKLSPKFCHIIATYWSRFQVRRWKCGDFKSWRQNLDFFAFSSHEQKFCFRSHCDWMKFRHSGFLFHIYVINHSRAVATGGISVYIPSQNQIK